MASGGYPGKYETEKMIHSLDAVPDEVFVYHAGTKAVDGAYVTSGGRVLGVTAAAKTLDAAVLSAYAAVDKISFAGAHYRKDIGRD